MRVSYLIPRRRDLWRSGGARRKIDAALMTVQQLAPPEDLVAVTVREKNDRDRHAFQRHRLDVCRRMAPTDRLRVVWGAKS
jgi:hypothetical protein